MTMDGVGELRFVSWGERGDVPHLRRAGAQGRALAGRLLQWDRPNLVLPRAAERAKGQEPFYEWFARGSLRMPPRRTPGLFLNHPLDSGHRVGRVEALYDGVLGPEALLLVDDGPIGDLVLAEIDGDGSRIPLSIAFMPMDGGTRRDDLSFPPGLRRTAVWLEHVAIVETPAFPEALVWMRGEPGPIRQALSGMGERRHL